MLWLLMMIAFQKFELRLTADSEQSLHLPFDFGPIQRGALLHLIPARINQL